MWHFKLIIMKFKKQRFFYMGFQSISSVHYRYKKNNWILESVIFLLNLCKLPPFYQQCQDGGYNNDFKRIFDATIILLIPMIYELANLKG